MLLFSGPLRRSTGGSRQAQGKMLGWKRGGGLSPCRGARAGATQAPRGGHRTHYRLWGVGKQGEEVRASC